MITGDVAPPTGQPGAARGTPDDIRRGTASPARAHLSTRVPRRVGFWLIAAIFGVPIYASTAPSPLYRLYQQRWHFSATTVTAVFGVYALVLLLALLVFGSLSDYVGRRPVIVAGLVLEIAATAMFLGAKGVGWLYVARILQGAAVGLVTAAFGAALIDLQPVGSDRGALVTSFTSVFLLGVGALATSALAQYAAAPTRLVWWLLLGTFIVATPVVLSVPESTPRRPGALRSLRPRLGVPRARRGTFLAGVPGLLATWTLSGFYLSLGPSLAAVIVGSRNLMWGGLAVFLLTGVAALSALVVRRSLPADVLLWGALVLLAGLGLTIGGIATGSAPLLLGGTAVAGLAYGPVIGAEFRSLAALAAQTERAGMVSSIYVVCYIAVAVPSLVAGFAASRWGLHDASLGDAAFAALLTALVGGNALIHRAGTGRTATHPGVRSLPHCPAAAPMATDVIYAGER